MRGVISEEQWEQLGAEANYQLPNLVKLSGVSKRQLRRIIRRDFGCSPRDWLNQRRIAAARERLRSGQPLKQVAYDLGFKQVSHFCRQFKNLNDMTPSEFILTRAGAEPEEDRVCGR